MLILHESAELYLDMYYWVENASFKRIYIEEKYICNIFLLKSKNNIQFIYIQPRWSDSDQIYPLPSLLKHFERKSRKDTNEVSHRLLTWKKFQSVTERN